MLKAGTEASSVYPRFLIGFSVFGVQKLRASLALESASKLASLAEISALLHATMDRSPSVSAALREIDGLDATLVGVGLMAGMEEVDSSPSLFAATMAVKAALSASIVDAAISASMVSVGGSAGLSEPSRLSATLSDTKLTAKIEEC